MADSECRTYVDNLLGNGMLDQSLFCINQLCKPCSPALWTQYNTGGATGVYTCAGYSKVVSDMLGRYATSTPMPAFSFRCASNGDIIVVNSTIDWNYQYPYGDRSTWRPGTSTFAAATVATAATTSTSTTKSGGSAKSGAATTTTTTSGRTGANSGAATLYPLKWRTWAGLAAMAALPLAMALLG